MRDGEPSKSSDKYGVDIRGVWILGVSAESKRNGAAESVCNGNESYPQRASLEAFGVRMLLATRPKGTEQISQAVRFINGIPDVPWDSDSGWTLQKGS